ncbi:DNA-binding domain-containing protein [Thalassobius sp. Cn5-15]|uniref:HvfC/BufC N-terminal domain-containing protein n=1 Tax=Thalassobius sp. Cn5-15 TaxID=2917763 RepID=UPI001EF2989C|nr:DNA-binding domain-containing protein [Thalassobius sp. Cn5-15]MCG7494422.1 DNA-binding domain-containing protein [Thalassobius sp. Cn5-15]
MSLTAFNDALLDPTADRPEGLSDSAGRPAGKRFDVYRNNVTVSLREALEAGFPATARLLGEQNFTAIATGYLRANPPSSPLMMLYGGGFPRYISNVPALAKLGYLRDVARLEYAMRQSYHAEDAPELAADKLAALAPEQLYNARLAFAPATQVVLTEWPIHAIRAKALGETAENPPGVAQPTLVTRPEFDPILTPLPAEQADLLAELMRNKTLAEASTMHPTADLGTLLGTLLATKALTDIKIEDKQ